MAKKEPTKSFVLRIDSEMMDAIEAWAADEFRSTNGQIQWILAEALKKSGRMKKSRKAEDKTDSKGPDFITFLRHHIAHNDNQRVT